MAHKATIWDRKSQASAQEQVLLPFLASFPCYDVLCLAQGISKGDCIHRQATLSQSKAP